MPEPFALILMAKAPIPGRVKTRLVPPLDPEEAARLYVCLLEDAAEEMARVPGGTPFLYVHPPGEEARFRRAPFARYDPRPQVGRDLGSRMTRAVRDVFREGFREAVLVGADCPALGVLRVREAVRELRGGSEAVLGPARDGGFYLAALRFVPEGIFRGIPWGTGEVLARVCGRLRREGRRFSTLPVLPDVDTPEDLGELARWARRLRRPACPRTRRWISSRGSRASPRPAG